MEWQNRGVNAVQATVMECAGEEERTGAIGNREPTGGGSKVREVKLQSSEDRSCEVGERARADRRATGKSQARVAERANASVAAKQRSDAMQEEKVEGAREEEKGRRK